MLFLQSWGRTQYAVSPSTKTYSISSISTILGIFVLLGLSLFGTTLEAQSYSYQSLEEFDYAVTSSSGTLDVGDTAVIEFSLGSSENPALHVVGVSIDFTLGKHAAIPTDLEAETASSWLFDDANFTSSLTAEGDLLSADIARMDGVTRDGDGFVFSIQLVCTKNGTSALELVAAVDGIVTVENVDLRLARTKSTLGTVATNFVVPRASQLQSQSAIVKNETSEKETLRNASFACTAAYPNPTSGAIHLPWKGVQITGLHLHSMDGSTMQLPFLQDEAQVTTNLSEIQPGIYFLEVMHNNVVLGRHRIVRRQ
jgi:hypothetical protein